MVSKRIFLWLIALPCAAVLMLTASVTSGQSTPQTTPSMGGMMDTPPSGMMTTPMGGMTGGAMQTTPGAMTGARGGRMGGSHAGGDMMAQMEESNRRLDELVSTMNSATGNAKVDAIAAVVNELVAQHRQMHDHMMSGHAGARGGKKMMGTRGTTSTAPGATTPRASRRRTTGAGTTSGSTSPAVSPTPMR